MALSPVLSLMESTSQKLGYQGMGPINKSSLPFYIGRAKNKATGRMATLKRPQFFIDPSNPEANITKSWVDTTYKWNAFLRSAQHSLNTMKTRWGTKRKTIDRKYTLPNLRKMQLMQTANQL